LIAARCIATAVTGLRRTLGFEIAFAATQTAARGVTRRPRRGVAVRSLRVATFRGTTLLALERLVELAQRIVERLFGGSAALVGRGRRTTAALVFTRFAAVSAATALATEHDSTRQSHGGATARGATR